MAKYQEAAPVILKSLEDGCTNKEAAERAGINEDTFYTWQKEKPDFSEAVQRAKRDGESNAITRVENSLLSLAIGFEYEEVVTEYESKPNPDPDSKDKYIPVIKKQRRTKKRVIQSVEAIKFYLSNKCPEVWKNRTDGNLNLSELTKGLTVTHVYDKDAGEGGGFPSSEAEVDVEHDE